MDYDDKLDNLLLACPCLHSDGCRKPTLKHPQIFIWFPEEICLLFHTSAFIGRMSNLNTRFCLETNNFFEMTEKNNEKIERGKKPTVFPSTNSPLGSRIPTPSRLETFSKKLSAKRPTKLHTTQSPNLFVTHCEDLVWKTGSENPIIVDEKSIFQPE